MIRLNGFAAWWEHKVLVPGDGTMQINIDFPGVPPTAEWIELEAFLDPSSPGTLVIFDGDGWPHYAGQVGKPWGFRSVIRARVVNRQLRFRVENGNVTVQRLGVLAYS